MLQGGAEILHPRNIFQLTWGLKPKTRSIYSFSAFSQDKKLLELSRLWRKKLRRLFDQEEKSLDQALGGGLRNKIRWGLHNQILTLEPGYSDTSLFNTSHSSREFFLISVKPVFISCFINTSNQAICLFWPKAEKVSILLVLSL